jgi:hypothetical protein
LSDGVTVDANIMHAFTKSLINKDGSTDKQLVEKLEKSHGFVIDSGGKMQHQWLETCGRVVFGEWLVKGLREGIVRQVQEDLPNNHKKKLQQGCGMPVKREIMYVAVANATKARYIVTNDIDFWDPKSKKQGNEAQHKKIKEERRGDVCRYLAKSMDIRVGTAAMALAEL